MPPRDKRSSASTIALILALAFLWASVWMLMRSRDELEQRSVELASRNGQLANDLRAEEEAHFAARESGASLEASLALQVEAKTRADENLATARREHFLAHIEEANAAWRIGHFAALGRHLEQLPDEHAGWEWSHFALRLERLVTSLSVHDETVSVLAASNDGGVFATGTEEGVLRVWERGSETPLLELTFEAEILDLDFDRGGDFLALATGEGELLLWDVPGDREVARHNGDELPRCLALAPDAKRMVAGFEGGAVCVWDVSDEPPRWLAGHDDDVACVALGPGLRSIASGSDDGTVRLFRGEQYDEVEVLEGHTDWLKCVSFGSRGEFLVSGADDGTVLVWSVEHAELVETLQAGAPIVHASLDDAGRLDFVTELGRGQLHSGHRALSIELPLQEYEYLTSVAWIPGEVPTLYTTLEDSVRFWQLDPPAPVVRLSTGSSDIRALAQSEDGSILAAGALDGRVYLFDAASGSLLHSIDSSQSSIQSLALTTDGERLVSGGRDGSVCVWKSKTGELLKRLEGDVPAASVAVDPKGEQILSTSWDGSATLWDVALGSEMHNYPAPRTLVLAASAGHSADRFVWIGSAGTVRVWSASDGTRIAALRDRGLGRVEEVVLSRDSTRLAAIASGNLVAVYDLAGGESLARVQDFERTATTVDFSPSGDRFAVGTLQGVVVLRDVVTGTELLALDCGDEAVQTIAFSPDGERLLVGMSAGDVLIWPSSADDLAAIDR